MPNKKSLLSKAPNEMTDKVRLYRKVTRAASDFLVYCKGVKVHIEVFLWRFFCLCRTLTYIDNNLLLNLTFRESPQTMVFTLNMASRKKSSPTMVLILNLDS